MNQEELETAVITACTKHEEQNPRHGNYPVCIYVGKDYFVKYGPQRDLEPERATQEYIFTHSQRSSTPDAPRIARIIHHFVDQRTMYIVMEHIKLQESPPDLATRIQKAIEWLSEVPLPPNHTLGPVGGGCIRHRFFRDDEAPFEFPDVNMLNLYIKKVYTLLSTTAQQRVSPVSVSGERLMFAQSDMDDSNFGVDEHGRTVLMDFGEVGVLPETFIASTLCSKKHASIAASLGLLNNSNLKTMAVIRHLLWMLSDPRLDMATGAHNYKKDGGHTL